MKANIAKLIPLIIVACLVAFVVCAQRTNDESKSANHSDHDSSIHDETGDREIEQMEAVSAQTLAKQSDGELKKSIRHWEESLSGIPGKVSRNSVLPLFSSEPGDKIESVFPFGSPAIVNMSLRHENGVETVGLELVSHPGVIIYLKKDIDGAISGHVSGDHAPNAIEITPGKTNEELSVSIRSVEEMVCSQKVGGILLGGLVKPEEAEEASHSGEIQEASSADNIPMLESRPGATNTIYLHFSGTTVSGTSWNARYNNGQPIVADAFRNSDAITEIWSVIAEDYRAFDVNVTTDREVFDNTSYRKRCMAIFTPTRSWFGSSGGVAYMNSFGDSTDFMCWVFNSSVKSAAEAGSHEVGHQLGLLHDGSEDKTYYSGHQHSGSGTKWAPIMGSSYSSTISQFSKGEYPGATTTQDDLEILRKELGAIDDDYGNTLNSALPPEGLSDGIVNISGIIGVEDDVDVFHFPVTSEGRISITAFPDSAQTNLDLKISILNDSGETIAASAPENSFSATIGTDSLEIGNYYLVVSGDSLGTPANGYSSYGCVGGYQISGECPPSGAASTPENFSATDGSSTAFVELTWTGGNNTTEYRVYRKTNSLITSYNQIGTTTTNSFRDESAELDRVYTYYVSAANPLGESDASNSDTGFRQERPSKPLNPVASNGSSTRYTRIEWDDSQRASKYLVYRSTRSDGKGETQVAEVHSPKFDDTSGDVETLYYYSITAVNAAGESERSAIVAGRRAAAYDSPGTVTTESFEGGILVKYSGVSGSSSYTVFRSSGSSADGAVEVGTVEAHEFYDSSASSGKTYTYFVRANGSSGNSMLSSGTTGSRSGATSGDDRFEANDRMEEAYSIQNFKGGWLGYYAGAAMALDEDWYSIVPENESERVDIILTPRSPLSQIAFTLRGESGEMIEDARIDEKASIISVNGLIAGKTYYIVVEEVESGDAAYNLLWNSLASGEISGHADLTIGRTYRAKIGDYIQETRARHQKVKQKVRGRRKGRNYASLTNKSVENATLVATGSRKNRKAAFKYFALVNGVYRNVTSAMARGGVNIDLAPLDSLKMRISMRPSRKTAKRGKKVVGNFGARFIGGASIDTGRFTYKVRKKK